MGRGVRKLSGIERTSVADVSKISPEKSLVKTGRKIMETNEVRLRSVGRVKKSIKSSQNGKNERLEEIEEKQDKNLEQKSQNGNLEESFKGETQEVGDEAEEQQEFSAFTVNVEFDLVTFALFTLAFCTRFYRLSTPKDIVFDELHYGRYVSMYLKNVFFFDQNPPLGKQLISAIVGAVGYEGNYTYTKIGEHLSPDFPIFWMRFLPAFCGSLLPPVVYKLLLEAKLNRWTALMGGILIVFGEFLRRYYYLLKDLSSFIFRRKILFFA